MAWEQCSDCSHYAQAFSKLSHRFVTYDWRMEQMGQKMEVGVLVPLDTIASYMYRVLCILAEQDGFTITS